MADYLRSFSRLEKSFRMKKMVAEMMNQLMKMLKRISSRKGSKKESFWQPRSLEFRFVITMTTVKSDNIIDSNKNPNIQSRFIRRV